MEKTRNLSVAAYFSVIQKEYFIAEFRRKIYYSPKDKSYYQRVMNHKAEKIRDISSRNHLDSIFSNPEKRNAVKAELFDEMGRPKFQMTKTDIDNYYSVGNEFSYKGDAWTLEGVNSDDTLTLFSPRLQERVQVLKEDVCRIL